MRDVNISVHLGCHEQDTEGSQAPEGREEGQQQSTGWWAPKDILGDGGQSGDMEVDLKAEGAQEI